MTDGSTTPIGKVRLPVSSRERKNYHTELIDFDVAHIRLPYNAILGYPACYPWAGLMGCEDMKAEDCTRVQIGLSLAWKASLAINYEDSFLCNRFYVNPRSSRCLYKPEDLVRRERFITIIIATLDS